MLTKYKIKARWPDAKIEEVEVVRETEHCLFLPALPTKRNPKGETKELKFSEWHEYHDSWEDAHAALTTKANQKVQTALRNLELANSFAGNVKGMRHNVEFSGGAPLFGAASAGTKGYAS